MDQNNLNSVNESIFKNKDIDLNFMSNRWSINTSCNQNSNFNHIEIKQNQNFNNMESINNMDFISRKNSYESSIGSPLQTWSNWEFNLPTTSTADSNTNCSTEIYQNNWDLLQSKTKNLKENANLVLENYNNLNFNDYDKNVSQNFISKMNLYNLVYLLSYGQLINKDEILKSIANEKLKNDAQLNQQLMFYKNSMDVYLNKKKQNRWNENTNETANCRVSKIRRRAPSCIECVFCKNNGVSPEFYKNHILKDIEGIVRCPVLREYDCPICRNGGGNFAHTIRYCPMNRPQNWKRAQMLNSLYMNSTFRNQ